MRSVPPIVLGLAILGLLFAPSFLDTMPGSNLSDPPSLTHPLGTTPSGEDVLAVISAGARRLFLDGLCCALFATLFGGLWAGAEAALRGTMLFYLVARFRAVADSIGPALPVAAFAAVFPRAPTPVLVIILGLLASPSIAGPIYTSSQYVYRLPYVEASRCLGVKPLRLFLKNVLPEISLVVVPWIGAFAAQAAAFLSGLGFLGIGLGSQTSLGMRLFDASGSIRVAPWFFASASVMTLIVLGLSIALGRITARHKLYGSLLTKPRLPT